MKKIVAKLIAYSATGLATVAAFAAILFASSPCNGPTYEIKVPDELKKYSE